MRKKLRYIIHVSIFLLILIMFVGCNSSDSNQTPQSAPSNTWDEMTWDQNNWG